MKERRRHPRFTLRKPVRAKTGETPLFVLDASRGGLRVAHRSKLPSAFRLDLPSSNGTIQLDCAIVHTSIQHANAAAESLFHSGLRIVTPDAKIDSLLDQGEQEEEA
ncbi:MAG TPA: PilZ domain-containing protein [Thermoanaerobaculia bacterium]